MTLCHSQSLPEDQIQNLATLKRKKIHALGRPTYKSRTFSAKTRYKTDTVWVYFLVCAFCRRILAANTVSGGSFSAFDFDSYAVLGE